MYDLSRLSDDEIALLERILKKASGELEGDVCPPFRIEFIAAEPTAHELKGPARQCES